MMKRSAAPSQQGASRKRFKPPFLGTPKTTNTTNSENTRNSIRSETVSPTGDTTNVVKTSAAALQDQSNTGKLMIRKTESNTGKQMAGDTKLSCSQNQSHALRPVQLSTGNYRKSGESQMADPVVSGSLKDIAPLDLDVTSTCSDVHSETSSCSAETVNDLGCSSSKQKITTTGSQSVGKFRCPVTSNTSAIIHIKTDEKDSIKQYFTVMWAKLTKKKHKTWEGDGVLIVSGRRVTLQDMEGKDICHGKGYKAEEVEDLPEGATLKVGGKEVEITGPLSAEAYASGRCFNSAQKQEAPGQVGMKFTASVAPKPFTCPIPGSVETKMTQISQVAAVTPRFDPTAPDALVMLRPSSTHQWQNNKHGTPVVDVVVDPHIAYHLRPHQRDGVSFLYQCVMGMKDHQGQGAILADEMGLGKTLQCIALIWTLLKQGPYSGKPVLKRVLVVTPGSLVKNWCHEFHKWLGKERLSVFAVTKDSKVKDFMTSYHPVLVVSYEMLVRHIEHIRQVKFDLIVCDEGHRLKNSSIKTASLISSLSVRRRVVLTGTPIQNDLQEFYSLVDFCNPGILGSSSAFHNIYEVPILTSRQPGATSEEVELGRTRSEELAQLTKQFILRRTQEVNDQYLPPKVEYVVFCRPSETQLQLYRQILSSRAVRRCLQDVRNTASHLVCIGALKKLCNHPCLIYQAAKEVEESREQMDMSASPFTGLLQYFPVSYKTELNTVEDAGKLTVLLTLLSYIVQSQEKVVLVSNYTKTLDVLEYVVKSQGYQFLRLDGQTPTDKRQEMVNLFNSKYSQHSIFLLSSKAGGIGLNLIGASRIILYDIDWNPATDLQAMARVWRDGQRKTVHIYRLITTGTIEEKIYQRQIIKQGLSGAVVDCKVDGSVGFSQDELKDIFSLHEDSSCMTHDMLQCECAGRKVMSLSEPNTSSNRKCQLGVKNTAAVKKHLGMENLLQWEHKVNLEKEDALFPASQWITMIFKNERTPAI